MERMTKKIYTKWSRRRKQVVMFRERKIARVQFNRIFWESDTRPLSPHLFDKQTQCADIRRLGFNQGGLNLGFGIDSCENLAKPIVF